ncbi:MAG: YbaB/EbfC family nucleoid-associated protein [Lactobacillales bacterium]|jgi:DNA-binding YbaB/EbfC family protein|nr:YbaB/EbfC family nucleoid-associated protein [Lactobacillales bacterium]
MKNIAGLMQKAQQVQTQMNALQNKMETLEFEGDAGSGAVKIIMTGKGMPVKLTISETVVDKNDIETLEDLIVVAIKDSQNKAQDMMNKEMERIQSALGLPAGMKLPF